MGTQLTELPNLDLDGQNLQDFGTYVRKLTSGGTQDFKLTLGDLVAQWTVYVASNKTQMRSLNPPPSVNQICFCLGGNIKNDNQGGIYFLEQSTDQDNGGDRIRPNNFIGYVWYKWLI